MNFEASKLNLSVSASNRSYKNNFSYWRIHNRCMVWRQSIFTYRIYPKRCSTGEDFGWKNTPAQDIYKRFFPKFTQVTNQFWGGRSLQGLLLFLFCFVTTMKLSAPEIWRIYRGRGDAENRIKELKYDFGFDSFNLKNFFARKAVLILWW